MIEGGRQSGGNSTINEFGADINKYNSYKSQQWVNYQHYRLILFGIYIIKSNFILN